MATMPQPEVAEMATMLQPEVAEVALQILQPKLEVWDQDLQPVPLQLQNKPNTRMHNIDKIDSECQPLCSTWMITLFHVCTSSVLTSQQCIIFEVVASFIVGLVAALIALTWTSECCFGAMAISGVLDLLQGFHVICSIVEIVSHHAVAGGANFLEGIFFTSLIAHFVRFGQFAAAKILGEPESDEHLQCNKGVSRLWCFLFVAVAAISWSGLFNPCKMVCHHHVS